MKANELLEWKEDKGSSVSITYEFLENYVDVLINIDSRSLRNKTSSLPQRHPDAPGNQAYELENWAKNNKRSDIIADLKEFQKSEKEYAAYLETETLELIESLKSMVNAMILEGNTAFDSKWKDIWQKHANDELKAILKKS